MKGCKIPFVGQRYSQCFKIFCLGANDFHGSVPEEGVYLKS